MKKTKEAKFFCESCGSEVPKNAKVCPTCGKFFASVRCPKCGKIGTTDEFANGCPDCGYAVNPESFGSYAGSFNGKSKRNGKNKNRDFSIFTGFESNKKKDNQGDSSLPVWIYILCLVVLVALVVLLYSCL